MTTRQAVFLVGGKGTRLGALTAATPKPLLEIAPGLRFLDVVIEEAARHGFGDILLLAGHLGEQVEAIYQGRTLRGATVQVVREPEPQGTGGALRSASDRLASTFLMANGDSLFDINLRALATELPPAATARLALREVTDPARYGAVSLHNGQVTGFAEKNSALTGPALINGGVYHMRREILDWISGPCSLEQDVFPRLAAAGQLEGRQFDGYFIDMGLPDSFAQACREAPARRIRPCLFLDRDGVLNVDVGYPHRADQLQWIDGAREAVRLANEAGYLVIVVTNQAGVARGYYTEEQVAAFHDVMAGDLARAEAHVDAWYHCPFHADATVARYKASDHPDRKPNPGMLLRAMTEWPIDAQRSLLIGDKPSDIEAAARAGIAGLPFSGGNLCDLVRRSILTGV
jgi:D-glycero-D-manno-heptose 1,7-bisphosphate phosphatase